MLRSFWLSSYRRLLPRWRRQYVLVNAGHETTGVVLSSPREPTVPRNFGFKTSWFALRTTDALGVARCLRLLEVKEAGWEEGLRVGYERPAFSERLERKKQRLSSWCFITPAIRGWTLVVGSQKLCSQISQDIHQEEESLVTKLSKYFGEAQAFATHRVVEYQSWIWAKDGVLLRSFAICGDNAEIVSDYGTLTPIEESFDWSSHYAWHHASSDLSQSAWFPDEFAVMRVARAWSVDPTALEEMSRDEFEGRGLLGRVPRLRPGQGFDPTSTIY